MKQRYIVDAVYHDIKTKNKQNKESQTVEKKASFFCHDKNDIKYFIAMFDEYHITI